jgi:GNAT superfamily N-acetyltransferase
MLYLRQCGPLDAPQLQAWADATLHKDYFFKKGHFHALCRQPETQVYGIAWAPDPSCTRQQLIGLAITGHGTTLFNLYLDPFWRSQGIGTIVVSILQPEVIRSKSDSDAGDPTAFYQRLGYKVIQEGQGKNGTIRVMQRQAEREARL